MSANGRAPRQSAESGESCHCPAVKPHAVAILARDNPEAIVLNFMQPQVVGRQLVGPAAVSPRARPPPAPLVARTSSWACAGFGASANSASDRQRAHGPYQLS